LGIFRMPPKHFRFESDVPVEQPRSTLRFVPRRSAPNSFGLASEYLSQRTSPTLVADFRSRLSRLRWGPVQESWLPNSRAKFPWVTLHRRATMHASGSRFVGFPSKYLIQRGKSKSGEPALTGIHSKCPASGWGEPGQNSCGFFARSRSD